MRRKTMKYFIKEWLAAFQVSSIASAQVHLTESSTDMIVLVYFVKHESTETNHNLSFKFKC